MNFSSAQKTTIKNWLDSNAASKSDDAAAALLNALSSPAYIVWVSKISRIDVQSAAAFDWTRVDNLSVGKARIWDWMFNQVDYFEPWRGNFRTGINAVWVGTQSDLDVRAAVNTVCHRSVTVLEKLFVVQTTDGPSQAGNRGSATNADILGRDASNAFIEGSISAQLVSDIRSGL